MKKVYVFFADGFEEIEALTSVDVLKRAGADVVMVSVTPNEIVMGAHEVPVLCDKNIDSCDLMDTATPNRERQACGCHLRRSDGTGQTGYHER